MWHSRAQVASSCELKGRRSLSSIKISHVYFFSAVLRVGKLLRFIWQQRSGYVGFVVVVPPAKLGLYKELRGYSAPACNAVVRCTATVPSSNAIAVSLTLCTVADCTEMLMLLLQLYAKDRRPTVGFIKASVA